MFDDFVYSEFVLTCEEGNLARVKKFVEDNPNMDIEAENGEALWCAVDGRHLDVIKFLVEDCQASLQRKDRLYLPRILLGKRPDIAKYFIEKGMNYKRFQNDEHWGHVYEECCEIAQEIKTDKAEKKAEKINKAEQGFKNNLEILKQVGATKCPIRRRSAGSTSEINIVNDVMDEFIETCKSADVDLVKQFVKDHPDMDVDGQNGRALSKAVGLGYFGIIKFLVEDCHADLNREQRSDLPVALYKERHDIAKYLIEKGMGYKELQDNSFLCVAYKECEEIAQEIKEDRAEQKIKDNQEVLKQVGRKKCSAVRRRPTP